MSKEEKENSWEDGLSRLLYSWSHSRDKLAKTRPSALSHEWKRGSQVNLLPGCFLAVDDSRRREGCPCPQWCVHRWVSQALVDCLTPTPCGHAWLKAVGQKKKIKQRQKECDRVGGTLGKNKRRGVWEYEKMGIEWNQNVYVQIKIIKE